MKIRLSLLLLLALTACCETRFRSVSCQRGQLEMVTWLELSPVDGGDALFPGANALVWIGRRVTLRGICHADPVSDPMISFSLLPPDVSERDIPFPGTRVYVWLRQGADLPAEASGRPIAVKGIFCAANEVTKGGRAYLYYLVDAVAAE